jgi:hypothetical protein
LSTPPALSRDKNRRVTRVSLFKRLSDKMAEVRKERIRVTGLGQISPNVRLGTSGTFLLIAIHSGPKSWDTL